MIYSYSIPQLFSSNELIRLKGAIFCHVNKIAWLFQFKGNEYK